MYSSIQHQKLTPNSDIDISSYEDVLDYAFNNNDVLNIAITGPYGAGKSSVVRSYEKKKSKKYLYISLAKFKNNTNDIKEREKDNNTNKSAEEEKLDEKGLYPNEIEGKILNQLIHQINHRKVRKSSFKITSNDNAIILWLKAFAFTYLGIFLVYILLNDAYPTLNINGQIDIHKTIIVASIIILIIVYFLLKSSRQDKGINRITFQGNTVDLFDKSVDSIFNKYMDDIIYLVNNSGYSTIIFEDIDRYDSNEIFVKLRELNYLINKRNNKHRFKFFYLIKDDQFVSKDRTKFFDLIIPILPAIDSSNSYDMLMKDILEIDKYKNHENNHPHKINNEFLEVVCFYIDDIRILKNIYNEYIIYHRELSKSEMKIINENLFAIICYKNIFPKDFVSSQYYSGYLSTLLSKDVKKEIVNEKICEYKTKIEILETEHKKIEDEEFTDIAKLIALELKPSSNNYYFYIEQNIQYSYNFSSWVKFIEKALEYRDENSSRQNTLYLAIEELENSVSYKERKDIIISKSNGKVSILEEEIEKYEKQIFNIADNKIKKLINTDDKFKKYEEIVEKQMVKKKFSKQLEEQYAPIISYLVKFGYIDEEYRDYLTPFLGDKNDKNFEISISINVPLEYEYKLNNPAKIIKKFTPTTFENISILNFSILEELFKNNENENLSRFIRLLITNKCEKFILDYARINGNIEIFEALINEGVKNSNSEKFVKELLSHNTKVLLEIPSTSYVKIKDIGFKINKIDDIKENSTLMKYVFENNLYVLTNENISIILARYYDYQKKEIDGNVYSIAIELNDEVISDYLKENVDIFLKLKNENDKKHTDSEIEQVQIINSNASIKNRKIYIEKMEYKIENLSDILEQEMRNFIVKKEKVVFKIENIIQYFFDNDKKLDDDIVSQIENSKEVEKIDREELVTLFDDEIIKKFYNELVSNSLLSDEKFRSIISNFKLWYDNFTFTNIQPKKIDTLIEQKIIQMTIDNIYNMRDNYPKNVMKFIKVNIDKYVEIVIENDLVNLEEMVDILMDNSIDDNIKKGLVEKSNLNASDLQKFIQMYDIDKGDLKNGIEDYCINNMKAIISIENIPLNLLNSIVSNGFVKNEDKRDLIILNSDKYEAEEVCKLIVKLDDFSKLKNATSNIISVNKENMKLLEILKKAKKITSFGNTKDGEYFQINRNLKNIKELFKM